MITIIPGDNRASLASLAENSIDAVVTDPPYNLKFMGKAWDATLIERDPEFWAAVLRVLKPGGCVFAFSGARTGHWQACAMEQAGFVMHPMHGWLYGQGFPKAADLGRAIDRHLGVAGGRGGVKPGHENRLGDHMRSLRESGTMAQDGGFSRPWMLDPEKVEAQHYSYVPGSPEAQAWDGWKYGTQTQKPAFEPIYLGQKPYDGKSVESILKWGVGAFNVDGCRVPTSEGLGRNNGARTDGTSYVVQREASRIDNSGGLGRYPANLCHDGSPEVVALFPESAGGGFGVRGSGSTDGRTSYAMNGQGQTVGFGDSGSAARFFNSFPPDMPPVIYHAKAGKADRDGSKHPTVKPIGLMRHLIRHICPPGGTVLDPFAGSGTTAEAARQEGMSCILMEQEPEYLEFLHQRFSKEEDPVQATLF